VDGNIDVHATRLLVTRVKRILRRNLNLPLQKMKKMRIHQKIQKTSDIDRELATR